MTDEQPEPHSKGKTLRSRGARYAYLRRDGTLDIVAGSLVAGLAAYAYQFLGGHTLGAEAFAPIGALLTAHFLVFVIILLPIEQFVIRRLTLGATGWVVPVRAVLLTVVAAGSAALVVWITADSYFDGDGRFVLFVVATVASHFFFVVARGYLAGRRRFRDYGYSGASAAILRLAIAIVVVIVSSTVVGFAWALALGPLVIFLWRPFRPARESSRSGRAPLAPEHVEAVDDRGLLTGLVLSSGASQAMLLSGPLVAGALGATDVQFSVTYATLLLARAPLSLGYSLVARILPPFTEMAARGERRELRAWARGMGVAGAFLAILGGVLGALLGPLVVSITFGSDFEPATLAAGFAAAGVVLAAAGLFVGQILVARGRPVRLATAWFVGLAAAAVALMAPIVDPVTAVTFAFLVGESVALFALVIGALMSDREEGAISHGYVVVKRSVDIGVALVVLVLLVPLLLIVAVAIRLGSRGPALYRQQRVGRSGIDFWMIRFRTVVIDPEPEPTAASFEDGGEDDLERSIRVADDPPVTRVGSVLRRWSLDELPNLWNVLKGSMSLVGPRPLVRSEARSIGIDNPRFSVKPGVTGLAQVRGRDAISLEDRTAYDIEYVAAQSLRLDFRILLATFGAVLRDPGDQDHE